MQIKNQTNTYFFIFVLALIILSACTEKYWPNLNNKYESLLVVDGKITNEPGPYTIKLSTSSSIQSDHFLPLENAEISIIDNAGNSELLQEIESGIYQSEPNGIQGIIGRSYKVSILINGKKYESSFEKLQEPIGIESINAEWEKHTGNTSDDDQYGFQFYITTETADKANSYFYWEISETYHYQTIYQIYSIYWGENENGKSGFERIYINTDSLKNCWRTNDIGQRFTYTTKNLSTPKINQLPINFTPNGLKFRFKYALQVKQFIISENAYAFLNSLKDQNDIEGSLYTSQPFQIIGNIQNTEEPEEPVLGYFLTAAVSESQPVLLKRPMGYNTPMKYGDCLELSSANRTQVYERVRNMPSSMWPIIIASDPIGETPSPILVDQECVNCETQGGVPFRPYYWNDESLIITPTDEHLD